MAPALLGLTWGTMGLDEDCPYPVRTLAVVLTVARCVPSAFRRLAPVPVWLAVGVVTAIHGASTVQDPPLFFAGLVVAPPPQPVDAKP